MASVEEISEKLEVLGVPHHVAVVRRTYHRRPVTGFEIRVDWDDLGAVLRWAPSLQRLIDAVGQPIAEETPPVSG